MTVKVSFLASLMALASAILPLAADTTSTTANVRDYGATGDGTTLDTAAIGKAIDFCFQKGGGTVLFPTGKYLTGTIVLKDNVKLNLAADATILGSPDVADYSTIDPFTDAVGITRGKCLIGAEGAKNIGIEGAGTINGQGKALVGRIDPKSKADMRPFLMRWVRCQGLTLQGVHLEQSSAWTVHIYQCTNVDVDTISISSLDEMNNDGIDCDSSSEVKITNCNIDSEDDSICLKATSVVPCKDITVTGCTVKSTCGTLKLGTESLGNFDNIHFSDCHVTYAGKGGIKLLAEDGAHMENVTFSNITMDKAATPIFLRLGSRLKTFRPTDQQRQIGSLKNVVIRDVVVHDGGTIQLNGIPGHPIEDITLQNIEVHGPDFVCTWKPKTPIPEIETNYPETGMFGRPPASGLWARHVSGIKLLNFQYETNKTDTRPFVVCEDAQDMVFSDWKILSPIAADSAILLQSAQKISLLNFVLAAPVNVFLTVEGAESSGIVLGKLDSTNIKSPFVLSADVKRGAVSVTP